MIKLTEHKGVKEIKISDIKGIKVGHAQNKEGATGCTVIICENGAFAGVDVRGSAPASRETELLKSGNTVKTIHAVMLSGGSAYGLDACAGAMQFLEEQGAGFKFGNFVIPIVCGAVIFDLIVGDPNCRPDKAMGYEACMAAGKSEPEEGNVGAGTGARVGKYFGVDRMMKGGVGIYAVQIGEVQCAAVVVVNALGDVFDVDTGEQIAGLLNEDRTELMSTVSMMYDKIAEGGNVFDGNTTLGCIITNAKLTKEQCNKLASIAHNGFARAIQPVHASFDGDTIFVMATGEVSVSADGLGVLAASVTEKAIARAVRKAEPAYGVKAACEIAPKK